MKIKKISCSAQHKINLGNFETIQPMVTLDAELAAVDDEFVCVDTLSSKARIMWAKESLRLIKMYRSFRKDKIAFDKLMQETVDELKDLIRFLK